MSKILCFILLGGLVAAALAVIDLNSSHINEDVKFIPISVLSKKQADYGADMNSVTIPAISADILEDKIHDTQSKSSVPIIRYTSLPVEEHGAANQENDQSESSHPANPHDNQGNNGNSNTNQNMNNGNSNAGSGNNNSNNGQENKKDKETRPDKNNGPHEKATTPKDNASEAAPDKVK